MKLVPNWRSALRMWSVRFQLAAAAFLTYLTLVPDAIIKTWLFLPDDIRSAIPPVYVQFGGIALIVLGTVARIVHQPKLAAKEEARVGEQGERGVPGEGVRDQRDPVSESGSPDGGDGVRDGRDLRA